MSCCPYQDTFDLLSRRHALTIIWLLQEESPRRFTQIKQELGVNPVTLSQRLGELERADILLRTEFKETPPRVEYALTEKGEALVPLIHAICQWSGKWNQVVAA